MARNMFRPVTVDDVNYPFEIATNARLRAFFVDLICPTPSKAVKAYMFLDIVQSLFTAGFCAHVMFRKGRMRTTNFVTLRRSPYGTFIVPNAVWTMLAFMSVYLVGWAGFCSYIFYISMKDMALIEWLFYIPVPWTPLAIGGFYAIYSFVLTCSPRSPISRLSAKDSRGLIRWYHLPLPHSAWVMNTFMIGVGGIVTAWTGVMLFLSARERYRANTRHYFIYDELLNNHTQEWLDAAPTAEALYQVRVAWSDLGNVYRWCCANLVIYMAFCSLMIAMVLLYCVPNHIYLLDHLLRMYPGDDVDLTQARTTLGTVWALWKIGRPNKLVGAQYSAFKRTWMVTVVGHSQSLLLLTGVGMFVVPPFYLYFVPWQGGFKGKGTAPEVEFIVAYVITAAFITAGWVTGLSAMLTYDDIYRAVLGSGSISGEGPTVKSMKGDVSQVHDDGESGTTPCTDDDYSTRMMLRPMQSFAPTSSSSDSGLLHDEKSEIFTEAADETKSEKKNKVLVVRETTVQIDHEEVEDLELEPGSKPASPSALSLGSPFALQPSTPYSYLGRKRTSTQ